LFVVRLTYGISQSMRVAWLAESASTPRHDCCRPEGHLAAARCVSHCVSIRLQQGRALSLHGRVVVARLSQTPPVSPAPDQVSTVKDVRTYVLALSESRSERRYWQRACQLLLDQADVEASASKSSWHCSATPSSTLRRWIPPRTRSPAFKAGPWPAPFPTSDIGQSWRSRGLARSSHSASRFVSWNPSGDGRRLKALGQARAANPLLLKAGDRM
jgi:hypothetical protein